MIKISNVHVRAEPGLLRWSAGFNYKRARYHVWFDPETLKIQGPRMILYRNPPAGVEYKGPGWFRTGHLDPENKVNSPLIAEMFEIIKRDNLIEAARQQADDEERARVEQAQTEYKTSLAERAGPILLEALKNARRAMIVCVTGVNDGLSIYDIRQWIEQADAAIRATEP